MITQALGANPMILTVFGLVVYFVLRMVTKRMGAGV